MSDYDRGAYAPHSDAPLAFDAREPRRRGPAPFSLIVGLIVLAVLAGALLMLYRGGVRETGDAPPVVGEPVGAMRTAPEATAAAPEDPALRLDVYDERDTPATTETVGEEPTFAPEPEAPLARPAAPPPVAVTPAPAAAAPVPARPTTAAPAPALRPAATAPRPAAPATARPAPTAPVAAASTPAPVALTPSAPVTPAAAPSGGGSASVQIGAFSSDAIANSELARTRGAVPGGVGVRVEPVQRNGATLYRGLVTGFASREEARAYCAQLQASARSCLVR